MSQFGVWLAALAQQAIAIMIGGAVAVGWGRYIQEWISDWREDRSSRWIAYIDVPREGGHEAYYYVGSLPLPERPPVQSGQYHTYREVSYPYVRWRFTPKRPIQSRRKLCLSLMTAVLTQGDGHVLQGHPLHPSQNSWRPAEPLGQLVLLDAAKSIE